MISIRRYLLVSLLSALSVGVLIAGIITYYNTQEEIHELYNKNMHEIAVSLTMQMEAVSANYHPIKGVVGSSTEENLKDEQDFLIQVWNRNKESVYISHPKIIFPLQEGHDEFLVNHQGSAWWVYRMDSEHFIIQVAQPDDVRSLFMHEISLHLLIPMLSLIPIMGLLIWLAVGRGLAPLHGISKAITQRSASSLEPLAVSAIPSEIQSMVGELNALLERLRYSLEMQKIFTADAAHELRTPLTVLKLQIDILARATDEQERRSGIAKLQKGIDRATHVVQQLLTFARLESNAESPIAAPVNLTVVVHEVVEHYSELALQKNIDLGILRTETTMIAGSHGALCIMLENLVDNALRYTPQGGKVDVCSYMEGSHAVIEVIDSGMGIAEEERSRVFERFYRVLGTQTDGTGLGLAIVKMIVERHKGKIDVQSGPQDIGTRFIISF